MSCRIYHGDFAIGTPAKLVCGGFVQSLTSADTLKFAFGFVNPPKITPSTTPSQISLPIFVYSFNPFFFRKTNFNLINGMMVNNGEDILAPSDGFFGTTSGQYQFPNDNVLFGDAHTFNI